MLTPVLIAATWSASADLAETAFIALLSWGYLTGLQTLAIHRSDESGWYRAGTVIAYPGGDALVRAGAAPYPHLRDIHLPAAGLDDTQ